MLRKLAMMTIFAAPFAAFPAAAQQAPSDQPAAAQGQQSTTERGTADALSGLEVFSADGQLVGQVAAAITDPNDNVEEIHVDIGTQLGIGDRRVSIESEQFTIIENRVHLLMSAAEVQGLPEAAIE